MLRLLFPHRFPTMLVWKHCSATICQAESARFCRTMEIKSLQRHTFELTNVQSTSVLRSLLATASATKEAMRSVWSTSFRASSKADRCSNESWAISFLMASVSCEYLRQSFLRIMRSHRWHRFLRGTWAQERVHIYIGLLGFLAHGAGFMLLEIGDFVHSWCLLVR